MAALELVEVFAAEGCHLFDRLSNLGSDLLGNVGGVPGFECSVLRMVKQEDQPLCDDVTDLGRVVVVFKFTLEDFDSAGSLLLIQFKTSDKVAEVVAALSDGKFVDVVQELENATDPFVIGLGDTVDET